MPLPLTAFEVAELPRRARLGRAILELATVVAAVLVALILIIAWGNQ